MAGKGTEVGRSFEEIAQIIDGVTHNDRLSVCFDTCHTHDAGYNVKDENIGFGHIGFDALNYVVHHDTFKNIPKILETPYVGEDKKNKKPPYKLEIDMLKSQKFDPELKNKILTQ